jgi:plasmid stabilization system protein ParE
MNYEVRKKPQAERDIEECFVYIGEDNLDIALQLFGCS